MQLRPRFDKAQLTSGQGPCNQFQCVKAVNADRFLVVGMEVRYLMRRISLCVHSNNDTEKATEFWHEFILAY